MQEQQQASFDSDRWRSEVKHGNSKMLAQERYNRAITVDYVVCLLSSPPSLHFFDVNSICSRSILQTRCDGAYISFCYASVFCFYLSFFQQQIRNDKKIRKKIIPSYHQFTIQAYINICTYTYIVHGTVQVCRLTLRSQAVCLSTDHRMCRMFCWMAVSTSTAVAGMTETASAHWRIAELCVNYIGHLLYGRSDKNLMKYSEI